MKNVIELISREITPADFFNINRRPSAGEGGGSQSYIDVPVGKVSLVTWRSFFEALPPEETSTGPLWTIEIHSVGGLGSQEVQIGQRRHASVNIRSQRLHTNTSNRIFAWHPDKSNFPTTPDDAHSANDQRVIDLAKGVHILILKTDQKEYWASWMKADYLALLAEADPRFSSILENDEHIEFKPAVEFNELDPDNQFMLQKTKAEESKDSDTDYGSSSSYQHNIISEQHEESTIKNLFDEDTYKKTTWGTERLTKTYNRNKKAVQELKRLYGNCQITGDQFVFGKADGKPYLEAHHLIPLGKGGSDNPANLIIVSAHIHKMLHYAKVEGLNLAKISNNKLEIRINGESHTITWIPEHAQTVADYN